MQFQNGLSTLNFAKAKDDDCMLFSFDIEGWCVDAGRRLVEGIPNCFLIPNSKMTFGRIILQTAYKNKASSC
jgi:hypothetical protein